MKAAADAEGMLQSIQHREEELEKSLRWSELTVMQSELSICEVSTDYVHNYKEEF